MKILLTGAFGNVGQSTLLELLRRAHQVRCFDVPTRRNRRAARRFQGRVELLWGDLRRPDDVARAVADQDVVLHLGFVIPHLSWTGVKSEEQPQWAESINVGGTWNLLQALRAQPEPPRILFTSSLHVYGRTQHLPPPRKIDDPVAPVEHYAYHKALCERLVQGTNVPWCILRLAAALPVRLILDRGMFDVPLDNRIEYVHQQDVATAIATAVETEAAWNQVWHVGGGPSCQYYQREIVERVLAAAGVGMLPESAFSRVPYSTDWLDTRASQSVLQFQQRTLDTYVHDLRRVVGWRRHLVGAIRPLLQRWLLRQSPYYAAPQARRPTKREPALPVSS